MWSTHGSPRNAPAAHLRGFLWRDGMPPAELLAAGRTPEGLEFVGVIQDGRPIETVAAVERLVGEASGDLPDGRVSLYVCPECGDLRCGAVTARLRRP